MNDAEWKRKVDELDWRLCAMVGIEKLGPGELELLEKLVEKIEKFLEGKEG